MGKWTDKAKGIYLDDRHTVTNKELLKVDFIIAWAGHGAQIAQKFTQHVQTAYDIGVPLLAYFASDPTLYFDMGLDESKWPAPDNDPQIKALDRMLKSGSVLRVFHGIMIDASMRIGSDGKTITDGWIVSIARHLQDMCWQRYRKPIYPYISPSTVQAYPGSQQFAVWLSGMDGISIWKSAYSNNPAVETASWDAFPIPADSESPDPMYAPAWYFWRYSNTKFIFPGIDGGAVPTFLYSSDRNRLYSDLGFTSAQPIPQPEPEQPPQTEPPPEQQPQPTRFITMEEKIHLLWLAHPELHPRS